MRKLSLQLQELHVESFVLGAGETAEGTVHGHSRVTEFCKTWNCPYTYTCTGGATAVTCQAHEEAPPADAIE